MLKFRHPINKMQLFANLGMSNGFMIDEINEREIFSKLASQETTETEPAIKSLKKYEPGIILGAGTSFNRFGLQFRYERSRGLSNALSFSAEAVRCYFMVSYRLK